jgi:hypothetical protein
MLDEYAAYPTRAAACQNLMQHLFPEVLKEVTIAGRRVDISRKIETINKAGKKEKRGKKKKEKPSLGLSAQWDSKCVHLPLAIYTPTVG